ncbi:hypothetical protein E2C01_038038 [Portunus trituberculatus]|uniref:Secreted protein n=1 Tax=Portunus trituberculatus TaxID=210409 RepID=A0A5B7FFP9_PORTR|nr:hypothetical protein [Portunus trituberculatus]
MNVASRLLSFLHFISFTSSLFVCFAPVTAAAAATAPFKTQCRPHTATSRLKPGVDAPPPSFSCYAQTKIGRLPWTAITSCCERHICPRESLSVTVSRAHCRHSPRWHRGREGAALSVGGGSAG